MASLESGQNMIFDALYGLEFGEMSPDVVRATCAVTPKVLQPFGIVHGGVYCSIAESITSVGTYLGVKDSGHISMGMSNDMSFLRPITTGTIHAEAKPRHRGRTTWIWDVEITNDDGALCAIGRITIAVRPRP
ncbi:MAG TPA: PaaI family thioesterase [Candidatus Saccharimonadales bacterium]|nr:PaaI family thioesterase [Candidatus Saccharimonadales bacterium]